MNKELKTTIEWLKTLAEPYRSQALENVERPDYAGFESAAEALIHGFYWGSTAQGSEYWNTLYEKLRAEEHKQKQNNKYRHGLRG